MALWDNDFIRLALVVIGALAIVYFVNMWNNSSRGMSMEHMSDKVADDDQEMEEVSMMRPELMQEGDGSPEPDDGPLVGGSYDGLDRSSLERACFPESKELTSGDLLPMNEAAKFSDVHPEGVGVLSNKSFLNSGHHVGINTVGQSLRNANHDFRSEPPNPQIQISPWQNTSIGSDLMRRHLEIGGCDQ